MPPVGAELEQAKGLSGKSHSSLLNISDVETAN
jgi:hypothetical protein